MTDKETIERVTGILKQLCEISEEKQIEISIHSYPEDYSWAKAGEYEVQKCGHVIQFKYAPLKIRDRTNIKPEQVNFNGKPRNEKS